MCNRRHLFISTCDYSICAGVGSTPTFPFTAMNSIKKYLVTEIDSQIHPLHFGQWYKSNSMEEKRIVSINSAETIDIDNCKNDLLNLILNLIQKLALNRS